MVKVGILGATGYTGVELVQRLERHPEVELAFVSSEASAGQDLATVFPQLAGCRKLDDLQLHTAAQCQDMEADVVFSCLPHTASAEACSGFLRTGATVIDLSADFRLKEPADYHKWYGKVHPHPELLAGAVYGLVERFRSEIWNAKLIANPGCYPTSVLLPLLPLLAADLVGPGPVVVDSKSGVSGAGRKATLANSFCEVDGSFSGYKIGRKHQHLGEMRQMCDEAAEAAVPLVFSPHLVPMERGILSTLYVPLVDGNTGSLVRQALADSYLDEPFVKVLTEKEGLPSTGHVRHTNRCHMAVVEMPEQDMCVVVSVIDNLIKGASGQALQNMNAALGMPETLGLI